MTQATEIPVLTVLVARGPCSRPHRVSVWEWGLHSWLVGSCLLPVPSHGEERELRDVSFLRTPVLPNQDLTLVISSNLRYVFRGPIFRYSPGGAWGASSYKFGGKHSVHNTWVQVPCLKFNNYITLSKPISYSKFSDSSAIKCGQ